MIRSFIYALICTFFFSLPTVAAENFFTTKNYLDGKFAYDKANYDKAYKLWEESAQKGYAEAQYFVGAMHHAGQSVPVDYKIAMEWYQKAAAQNHAQSQLAIGALFADGRGVEKDNKKARMWFAIADINGSDRGEAYIKRIDTRMTPEEIEQSEKMAVDWINKNNNRR